MEENKNNNLEENPSNENKKEEAKKENKIAAFFKPKRNKIIVGVSAVAVVALIVGLSVGLSTSNKNDGGSTHTHSVSTGALDLNSGKAQIYGVCSTCNETVLADVPTNATFTSVRYGYYPQKHVSDADKISALDAMTTYTKKIDSHEWYLLDGTYYEKANKNVRHYDYCFDDGVSIFTTQYNWFSVDPIEWDILSSKDGQYSLVSSLLLNTCIFDGTKNNYKESGIRAWLCGDASFCSTAFSGNDSFLVTTTVDNSAATTVSATNEYACDNTEDKVYLLSYQDYNNTTYFKDASARLCKTTDFARNNYAKCNIGNGYTSPYWTRSPYSSYMNRVSYVNEGTGEFGEEDKAINYFCVRPAITISIA